ncbi:hypothetical protein WR25_09446 isoform G [Diploscapter pachys]|uniref:Mannosyltransferase n=1 Tax=Diploscapter pachys TaxID=2018661 RepID=A0A2A2K3X2_9BILA|nr:hypothetical protein WR25_09446 isoform A [Diploscapter pachys]PAV68612.1 hypothetical protein WR25_09446 isoform B [Diploscapter pachys]PAV68613.1 hypothetical protein WR25_09446 isoform C [Diploscapter pachys]PAV68614.1 hypothetical protein WR25_09446 isoform D [Diploscapter pachys]PAV68617.1 hypothetical protein WR25_09446 isoform G [Diploscapter pachys]
MVLVVFQRYLDKQFLSGIRWAAASMVLFRFDLFLLYCPMFLPVILLREVPIFGWNGAIATGLSTLLQTLAPTIAFDSFLWGRLVWPEAEVFWFNVVENRSHEYGVSPFLWYFLSALPRSLLLSLLLVPIGLILDRRLRWPVGIILVYIFLFSILPHKELRFIIYSIPMLNVPAAMVCARAYQSRTQSWIRLLLYFGLTCHILANTIATLFFIFAASHNYPGYEALGTVQWMMRADANKPYSVYIDNTCAQTGVNRFMQMYEKWNYDKTENLPLDQATSFDFICVGTYGRNLTQIVAQFDKTHRPMFAIPVFDGMKWKKMSSFPFYWPEVRLLEKVAMLRSRQHMS